MNEIVKSEVLSIEKITGNVQLIQQAMQAVMKQDVHYGAIKGCGPKPSLLKPGAEVIMTLFRFGGDPIVETVMNGDDYNFIVRYRGFYIPTGNTVGYGLGAGSTLEDKYAWRAAICEEEFNATTPNKRRIHWQTDYNTKQSISIQQVRQNPATIANTVLKMTKKRAQIDFCLTATACSDMFTQDMEDEDGNIIGNAAYPQKPKTYQQSKQSGSSKFTADDQPGADVISQAQSNRLFAISKSKNLTNEESSFIVFSIAGVNRSTEIPRAKYEAVIAAIETAESGKVM
jgi:hypothetical protein